MPDGDNGLVCAYALDGQGGGRALDWPEVEAWQANEGLQWVHLSRRADGVQRWLEQKSGLDPVVQEALLAEETRPHCDLIGDFDERALRKRQAAALKAAEVPAAG